MDWEGKIGTSHLTCSVSNRALTPGEFFFSALVVNEREFKRLDFCKEVWDEQDQSTFISWWRQKVPEAGKDRKPFKLNAATLAQIFTNLKDARTRSQQCLAYVVALALVRARKLQFIEVQNVGDDQFILVQNRAEGIVHRIRDPRLESEEEAHVLHNLLALTTAGDDVVDDSAT
jgi:hypothetical protein